MSAEASAKARETRTELEPDTRPTFLLWLRTWRQVLIAELLHILDHRASRAR